MSILDTCTSAAHNPLVLSCYRPQIFFPHESTFICIIHRNLSYKNQSPLKESLYASGKSKKAVLGRQQALTVVAVVIDKDYLLEQVGGRPMDHRMNGTQDDRQCLVHKYEDDADLW